jgi:hypothetical protein
VVYNAFLESKCQIKRKSTVQLKDEQKHNNFPFEWKAIKQNPFDFVAKKKIMYDINLNKLVIPESQ